MAPNDFWNAVRGDDPRLDCRKYQARIRESGLIKCSASISSAQTWPMCMFLLYKQALCQHPACTYSISRNVFPVRSVQIRSLKSLSWQRLSTCFFKAADSATRTDFPTRSALWTQGLLNHESWGAELKLLRESFWVPQSGRWIDSVLASFPSSLLQVSFSKYERR